MESGRDKIRKICEIIKEESLEPAQAESKKIVDEAKATSEKIVREAEERAKEIIHKAQKEWEKELKIHESALQSASKNALASLKEEIESRLFQREIESFIEKATSEPEAEASLIQALVTAIEKEGVSADFSAYIPKKLSAPKVTALLSQEIVQKLRGKKVSLGDFAGGVQIKLHDKNMVLDLSDTALKELLGRFLRKDFRKAFFLND